MMVYLWWFFFAGSRSAAFCCSCDFPVHARVVTKQQHADASHKTRSLTLLVTAASASRCDRRRRRQRRRRTLDERRNHWRQNTQSDAQSTELHMLSICIWGVCVRVCMSYRAGHKLVLLYQMHGRTHFTTLRDSARTQIDRARE